MANELTHTPNVVSVQVQQVIKWIVSGATSFDVAGAIATQYPQSNVGELLNEAMLYFDNSGSFDANVVTGWVFESTKEVYRRALEAGDYSTALRALGQIGKMADVRYSVQKVEEQQGESV